MKSLKLKIQCLMLVKMDTVHELAYFIWRCKKHQNTPFTNLKTFMKISVPIPISMDGFRFW
jgi:hypothetical protein